MFFDYACKMLDPMEILTTFSGDPTNDCIAFQLVLRQCMEELRNTEGEGTILHVNDIKFTQQVTRSLVPGFGVISKFVLDQALPDAVDMVVLNFCDKTIGQKENLNNFESAVGSLKPNGIILIELEEMYPVHVQTAVMNVYNLFTQVTIIVPEVTRPNSATKYLLGIGFNADYYRNKNRDKHEDKNKKVRSMELLQPDWKIYLTGIENRLSEERNLFNHKALDLAIALTKQRPADARPEKNMIFLKRLLQICLKDPDLRRYGLNFCSRNQLEV